MLFETTFIYFKNLLQIKTKNQIGNHHLIYNKFHFVIILFFNSIHNFLFVLVIGCIIVIINLINHKKLFIFIFIIHKFFI